MGRLLRLAEKQPVLRARDVAHQGIHTSTLTRMAKSGVLEKVGPGRYRLSRSTRTTEHHDLAVATATVPRSVVCLISALRFHGLTTQSPHEVWLALPPKAWSPRVRNPKLRIMRFSGASLKEMVKEHEIEGVKVKIYTPAKTVADCFKFRNKIGLDVAMEAMRDCWREKRATMDDLWAAAQLCRMENVMRPYLESLV